MKSKIILYTFLLFSHVMMATISLPSFFSNGMVLQRNSEVKIWGWANPKEEIIITTSWNNKIYKTTGSNLADWKTSITTPKEGGPYSITIKGYNEVILSDILIGEVWLCSGQSNMEMSANWGIENGDDEVKNANHPFIRFFSIEKAAAHTLQNNLIGSWKTCTPEVMKYSSAVAYFFGKRLQEDLKDVPIGLLVSAWGGTPAEVWIPENAIESDKKILEEANKRPVSEYCPVKPGLTYNAMIHPLVGYKIAGTIWYQGESNVGSNQYDTIFSLLISSWRTLWGYDFPFYFVQIAPFSMGENHFSGAILRNSQRKTLRVKETAMVVTSDISTIDDIHPKNKKSVGIRLANVALANIYKTNPELVNSPILDKIEVKKNNVFVYFNYSEGLHFKDKNENSFEIAGSDGIFYPAKAVIKNDIVIVTSNKVKDPIIVRFAWSNTFQTTLVNKSNLPASLFESE
ncbi:Sialate O-acetylesterase [Flavobacterium sp. 9AF]|uniref:sialate O-acetylesterase n=1 Tax=Flavobacterium sp. 9AF TaxID=2653142 RepID=UPI0012EEFA04|nr:sialate O-acetylesterase [Flavobacterium sp. 9AF]VXB57695.1 Sialate O-acetylesterase [Flavobacterium sp. 9AF]